jgi:membrane-associated phospholipid phosphatase
MTILVAWSIQLTGNKKLTYFAYFTMISVIISVIYLSIHWITDVVCGALLAIVVIFILNRYIGEKEKNG